VIYYIAHWDWILKNSRFDIVKDLEDEFKISGITPVENSNFFLEESYSEVINWNYKRGKVLDIKGVINLRKIITNFNTEDLIHLFTLKSLIIFLLSSIFTDKKTSVMASITGLGFLFASTNLALLLRIILRPFIRYKINKNIDVLIFQNKSNLDDFISYSKFSNKALLVEGSGLDTDALKTKDSFNQKLKVIFVSRLLKEKGFYEFIEIINKKANDGRFEFYIAGSIDEGTKSSISNVELENVLKKTNVTYLGEIKTDSELHKYDILISPSHHEGFSRIILEAGYIGLLCLANNIPGTKNIIEVLQCGTVVDNNNIEQFVKELDNYEDNISKLNYTHTREIVEQNYSVSAVAKKMKEIYSEFI
jgi:glycosyltransferase involved in cell wall biosynthesis